MDLINNNAALKLTLEVAAEEAFRRDNAPPSMLNLLERKKWIERKITEWVEVARKKYEPLRQYVSQPSKESVATAHRFYRLQLGESAEVDKHNKIIKVPGGWIWQSLNQPHRSIFIPFSDDSYYLIESGQ